MKLRTNLLYLITGTLVPLLLLTTFLGVLLVRRERDAFRQGAINRNRAFMTAVDAALDGHVSTLQAMAATISLESGDFETFRRDAVRAVHSQPDWQNVILTRPDGTQVVNAGREESSETFPTADTDSLRKVVETRKPAIGGVVFREDSGNFGIAIRVPVVHDNKLLYIWSAIIEPDQFGQLIRDQHLPDGWISGLVDTTGHYIARVPPRPSSDIASTDFLNAIKNGPEGWYRGRSIEGKDFFTAYKISEFSNWSVGLGIPGTEVNAGVVRAIWIMGTGTAITVGLALGFAYWMGRRITVPVAALAEAARAMGRNKQPLKVPGEKSIQEVRALSQALAEANEAMHERQRLAEREQESLKAADRAKDEFIAMLGHELRNPLAAITTSTEVLKSLPPGDPVSAQAHEVISRQTRHMTRMVEDLLNISRLKMGKVNLQLEPFDLANLARKVVETWEQSGRVRWGRIMFQSRPVWINGDQVRMEQVLSNLLDNALKYSPANKPIDLRVQQDGSNALIEVKDEGEGIEKDLQARLFGLFVQGPRGPDRARGGLGLGLALVKSIVELHGGSITVFSDGGGRGAKFTLRVPAIEAPSQLSGANEVAEAQSTSQSILVVEDNDDAREMMEAMLTLDGHNVCVAAHGTKALEQLQSRHFDVVLLDIGLPDLDGYEVARRMRALTNGQGLRIIALTGYGQADDQRKAREAGFDLHLTKPVALDRIRELLAQK